MINTGKGAIPLFKVFGIRVFLHWSWFLVAYWQIEQNRDLFGHWQWMAGVYLTLFGIILAHEFGHALACRSVGGRSEEIILWPFGGIAFVQPPQRPGAVLWSLAAGPLVNVLLIPVLFVLEYLISSGVFGQPSLDLVRYAGIMSEINRGILLFNLLPIYPLDGGQITRALLWYGLGQLKSLLVATALGLVGGVGLALVAWFYFRSLWMVFICLFLLSECWKSFRLALDYQRAQKSRLAEEPPPVL